MVNFLDGIWFLEDKGNWVAGGDPELVDVTDFTAEGNDYWTAIYASVERGGAFVADYEDIPGWTATDVSIEEGHLIVKCTGTFQGTTFTLTQTKEDDLYEFFRNHSSLSDSKIYFVKRWSTDHYKLFPDQNRTMRKYCLARFMGIPKAKIVRRVLQFSFTIRSMWGS